MRKTKPLPTVTALSALFDYNAETGDLIRKTTGRSAYVDAGSGYHAVCFAGKIYLGHRLVWMMAHGSDPGGDEIDHINGDRKDNRLINLRRCTSSQNNRNRRMSRRNKSGVKGIYWETARRKWFAICSQNFIGRFDKLEDAAAAVIEFRSREHGEFANHAVSP